MKDFAQEPLIIGILGSGIMGRGIAQIAATAGVGVQLYDLDRKVCDDAVRFIEGMLDRAVEKGRLTQEQANDSKAKISIAPDLGALNQADLVIEAVVEKLEIKQQLFRELEEIVTSDCILATNTSSLSVTAVANAVKTQSRVAGCHFFNPVPLMKLVEVIAGVRTDAEVISNLIKFVKRIGHTPVNVKDSPGFLVNHFGRGLNTEGLRVLAEGVAEPHNIDKVIRDVIGLRMGPFELMDLTALDVTCPVSEQIYEQFYHESRLRPTPTLRQRFIAGILGRKAGEGFYLYENGEKVSPAEQEAPDLDFDDGIWVSKRYPMLADKLIALLSGAGIKLDHGKQPESNSIIMITPLGQDTTTAVIEESLDPVRSVAVDVFLNIDKRITLMGSPGADPEIIKTAWSILARTGRNITVIKDSTGFIAQRIFANIINTACEIAQLGIALPDDIDTAARLGLGYPQGPLTMGNEAGPDQVMEILKNIQSITGDQRYRPSLWLQRRAALNLSLFHCE